VPDPANSVVSQRVAFGTSGHRGSAFATAFNEAHILAIAQAVCLYRKRAGIDGPLFLGMDTHALSEPAFASALEVLAANGVETMIDAHGGYTPTPVISHAILTYNRGRKTGWRTGSSSALAQSARRRRLQIQPANGGPADVDVTGWIENAANEFLGKARRRARIPYERARKALASTPRLYHALCRRSRQCRRYGGDPRGGVRIGIDPLGGAAVHYWQPIIERYKIAATVVNDAVDPTFRFMTVDWDGKIRMDCSSPYAMTRLIACATSSTSPSPTTPTPTATASSARRAA
jgi:phosphoglucomutase